MVRTAWELHTPASSAQDDTARRRPCQGQRPGLRNARRERVRSPSLTRRSPEVSSGLSPILSVMGAPQASGHPGRTLCDGNPGPDARHGETRSAERCRGLDETARDRACQTTPILIQIQEMHQDVHDRWTRGSPSETGQQTEGWNVTNPNRRHRHDEQRQETSQDTSGTTSGPSPEPGPRLRDLRPHRSS